MEGADLFIFRKSLTETDYLMIVCRVFAIVTFIIGALLGCFPLKLNLLSIINKKDCNTSNFLMSFGICIIAAFVGAIFPELKVVFRFAGSACCSVVGCILPLIMAYKINYV